MQHTGCGGEGAYREVRAYRVGKVVCSILGVGERVHTGRLGR